MAAYLSTFRKSKTERVRKDPWLIYTDEEVIREYRLDKNAINELCEKLSPHLHRKTKRSNSLTVREQILIALKVLAAGSFQSSAKDAINVSQPTVSSVLSKFLDALISHAPEYIFMPSQSDIAHMKRDFYEVSEFPRVIGAVDGTYIGIIAPAQNEHLYVCRKGFHSINVQAICDKQLVFWDIVIKWPGSTHDSFILTNSHVYDVMEEGTYGSSVILGDSGYPLKPWLMTPILHPQTRQQHNFNIAHKKTRVFIERAFGVLKMRWRAIDHTGLLCYTPTKASKRIMACVILHNICRRKNIPLLTEFQQPSNNHDLLAASHSAASENPDGRTVRDLIVATFDST